MENGIFKCLTSCFPRCRCRCLKRHRNRIGPSKPLGITVSKYAPPQTPPSTPLPASKGAPNRLNGETNLYFQGDEVIFSSDITDASPSPPGPPCLNGHHSNSNNSLNGDCLRSQKEDYPESTGISLGFHEFLSTVFLQLSKDKQLRVIHIKSKRPTGDPTDSNPVIVQNSDEHQNDSSSGSGSDDDEEYWFTKWSKRPKLKNTFKPKPSDYPKKQVILAVNSRARLSYEELSDFKESSSQDPLKKSPSSPTLTPNISLSSPPSQPESCSSVEKTPDDENRIEIHRKSITPSTPCDNYQAEWPLEDHFQQEEDEDPNGNELNENAFTNFGFHLEPEDSSPNESETEPVPDAVRSGCNGITINENQKTENGVLETNPAESPMPSPKPEPIKSNGFIRRTTSPSQIEAEETSGKEQNPPEINSKPLLFFIHGISGSSDTWKSQFKFFHDRGYEIVAPDLIGHGMSSTPRKSKHYLFESFVQDLVTVFDHFASESRISVIIGHGYGACMGTVLSRIRSQNVSLLISVSGGGPTPLIPFGCLERPMLPFRLNLFNKKKSIGRFDNPDLRHILPESIHEHILNGQLWVEGDAAFHRRISVPTLLVYGLRDTVVSLVEECEMERTIPKAFLELLPSAGHMVMWDEPKKFNRMLNKFIQAWT